MNVLDIIIIVILIWAAVSGGRQGIVARLCGFAGIVLGVWLAFRFSSRLGEWIGFELSDIAAFAILFIVALLIMILFGRIAKGVLKWTGLGIIDRIGGVIFGIAEYALILGLLIGLFDSINSRTRLVEPQKIEQSALYKPIKGFSDFVFPYIIDAKDALLEGVGNNGDESKPTDNTQNI